MKAQTPRAARRLTMAGALIASLIGCNTVPQTQVPAAGGGPAPAQAPAIEGQAEFSQTLTVDVTVQASNNNVLGGNADSGQPSVVNGVFTGGAAFPLVSVNGQGCPFRVTGGWLAKPGNFPTGYSAHFDGKIDIDCPTPASSATWGRIKGQYR